MRFRAAIAAVAVLALTAACSSSGGDDAPLTDKYGLTQTGAKQALLTPGEVGSGLAAKSGPVTEVQTPCDESGKSVASQFDPRAHAAVTYADSLDSFEFTEVVENFDGAATTSQVLTAIKNGLSCDSGYLGRIPVQITGPLTVKLTTPVDSVALWTINSGQARQSVIVAELGTQVVQLIFGSAGMQQTSVDAADIAQRAVAKVKSTLGG